MSTLVSFFSHYGHTAALAHQIAMRLGATEDPILKLGDRSGPLGIAAGAIGAALGQGSRIAAPEHDPADFDLVVIGTPVWTASAAPAVNRYIDTHRDTIDEVAFFCTEGGTGDGPAFARMERRLGKAPIACLAVTEKEQSDGEIDEKLARFVEDLGAVKP